MKLNIQSIEQTQQLAEKIAPYIKDEEIVILLDGDLGAGKTTFTKALGKALGVKRVINSPTFNIMKSYTMADGRTLNHIDAYRLEGISQDLGFEESFEDAVTVIEWAGFMKEQIPQEYLSLSFKEGEGENREITLEGKGKTALKILEALA